MALAIPAAFLARDMWERGVLPGELALLIALYFGSVALIPFLVWLPIAPIALGALMALLRRRARVFGSTDVVLRPQTTGGISEV